MPRSRENINARNEDNDNMTVWDKDGNLLMDRGKTVNQAEYDKREREVDEE